MAGSFPHITISIAHGADDSDSSGDLNSLCVGFGVFQAWMYLIALGSESMFGNSANIGGLSSITPNLAAVVFDTFTIAFGIFLLFFAFSNQLFLKFYVGKKALVLAAALASVGTYLIYASCFLGPASVFAATVAGVLTAIGASSMVVLWGTAFSRYEFTTIILNTAAGVVIGLATYFVFVHWVVSPFAGLIAGLLPVATSLLLWKLTPVPYYRRQEMPIFHSLPIRRVSFVTRFGVPTFIFGFSIGALRFICVDGVMLVDDITSQLVVGAAACAGVGIIIATVALTKSESHWDMIFRCLVPIIAGAIFFLPYLESDGGLFASFMVVCGYLCFESLMWIFFSDISQEFRLSPIFVFGLGRGLLTLASFIGANLAQLPTSTPIAGVLGNAEEALLLMLSVVVAYALLPREREIRAIIDPTRVTIEPGYEAFRNDYNRVEALAAEKQRAETEAAATAEAEAEADERARAKGRFHARCEEIADRYLLSRRETEVMFLLAKGHNAAFIQDKLCISKSTAKTHINHIYRKLDIHTQQELLNMVEDRPSGAEAAADEQPAAARQKPGNGVRADIFEPRKKK